MLKSDSGNGWKWEIKQYSVTFSLFNTTIAFDRNNIVKLFDKIYGGSLTIKY